VNSRPRPGNLPAEISSFVGRRRELADARRLLASARLVTLTGPGGVGKSRLGVRVAMAVRRSYPDGTWLVELSGLPDPSLLPHAVAGALGVVDRSAREPASVLADYLANRQLLLILDNCEHLVATTSQLIAELLRTAPGLRVLTTSRQVLYIPGEQVYPVAPLAVPASGGSLGARDGSRYPGMVLFADRAAAVRAGFAVTDANAQLVARVCRRLDGMPLAIELAAARLRSLSLEHVAARLDDRFELLTTGNTAALPRHQTLRAAVEWSYELCTKDERLLWARASVFDGRFDLDAAEHVCGPDDSPNRVYESLAGLVDKSVLIAEEQEGDLRYRMLETVRQFGLDRLRDPEGAPGEGPESEGAMRRRHRDWYLDLAERFDRDWFGPRQPQWSRQMCAEVPNLRAALSFCLDNPGQAGAAVRLAGALYYLWYACGETREGRYWLERVLQADADPSADRLRAMTAYSRLRLMQGEHVAASEVATQCLALAERFGHPFHMSHALQIRGLALAYAGSPEAAAVLDQAVATARRLGPTHPGLALATLAQATERLFAGAPTAAGQLLAECQDICRSLGDRWWLSAALNISTMMAFTAKDMALAGTCAREGLRAGRALTDTFGTTSAIEFLAWVAGAGQDNVKAARLLGATDRQWRSAGGSPFTGVWADGHDRCEAAARATLGASAYLTEFRRGGELPLGEAIAYALSEDTGATGGGSRPGVRRGDGQPPALTRREVQVVELVAEGLSNKQIAARLAVAQRTAESHVENILNKLSFTSRAQIAAWYAGQRSRSS
jgi:predicted ATPase/DNA-binding CsgD family transcriptional regulator